MHHQVGSTAMLLVKKYPNRRLYDTKHSRYITLDDLEKMIRGGDDVAVQDAQDGRDLTQETLTQIILDRGGGKILPATLLLRMIRLDDVALGEFLGRYVSWALEVYLQAKGRARAFLPLNPLATAPFAATDALARLVLGAGAWGRPGVDGAPPEAPPIEPKVHEPPEVERDGESSVPAPPPSMENVNLGDEMARMRREIELLKESMHSATRAKTKRSRPKKTGKRAG